jgi:hypothetical protein
MLTELNGPDAKAVVRPFDVCFDGGLMGESFAYLHYEEACVFLVIASAPGVARSYALFPAGRSAYYEHLGLLEPSYSQ